ncbi:hypothetical protein BAE44_0009362 [Dichanthelium oligosanthes]|uniref:Uncharacterized protein n=1 Tax=Dichanthelium oligosanthes TaxID=888268 RepID=A0A1E5VX02_9POAL|nr:hypothetical protein BAE44_0009362 [Dichanthelium oligosanthes]
MVRGGRPVVAGGMVGPWLLIAVLVHSSFLGSTVFFTAVDAARASPFVVMAPLPLAPAPSPADNVLGDSKRKVPTGSNPLHNR